MNKIPFTLLKFTKPINSGILQYKSIIFPDSNPYRIICHIDEYSNTNDDIHQIYSCVLTTKIYPFFERQWGLHIHKNNLKKYLFIKILKKAL